MPIIVGLTKMTYFAKLANLARIHQRSSKKFKWDNKRGLLAAGNFHENGKNPSKVLQNRKWGDKEGNRDKRRLLENGKFWAIKGNLGKNGEYAKKSSRLLPNIQIRWQKVASWQMAILRKLQIWQEFIGLAKIKTRSQKRHVDNCGFYENDKFCEIGGGFGFTSGLAKSLNETTKEAFLVCNHETRPQCWESIQYNFSRIINMKTEFGSQRREMLLFLTTNMAAVTSLADQQYWQLVISRNEVTKRGNLTNDDYKKMANFRENGKFRQKWRVQEFGQIQMRWQKGASWQMTIL